MISFRHHNEDIIGLNEHLEDLLSLRLGNMPLESKFALHVVCSVFSAAQIALSVQDLAFALPTIIWPFSIENLLDCRIVHATSSIAFAVQVLSVVDIATQSVEHATALRFTSLVPTTFIDASIQVDDLSVTLLLKLIMLTEVNITGWV